MLLNEYQRNAMKTCMVSSDNDAYMLLGFVGKVGEVTSKVAKWIRKGFIIIKDNNIVINPGVSPDDCNMMFPELEKELGDCLWFIAGLAHTLGLDLESVAQHNLEKLASRQKRGVIDGNGDNR